MPHDAAAFLSGHFPLVVAVAVAWPLAVIAVAAALRTGRDLPVVPRPPADALYLERFGSGRSHRGLLSSLGWANNCLIIAVTPDRLMIAPWFPFNLLLPQRYGLEASIALADIVHVEVVQGLMRRMAQVVFRGADGSEGRLDLRLGDMDAFLTALARDRRLGERIRHG